MKTKYIICFCNEICISIAFWTVGEYSWKSFYSFNIVQHSIFFLSETELLALQTKIFFFLHCFIWLCFDGVLPISPTKNFIPSLFLLKLSFLRQYGINPARGGRKFFCRRNGGWSLRAIVFAYPAFSWNCFNPSVV